MLPCEGKPIIKAFDLAFKNPEDAAGGNPVYPQPKQLYTIFPIALIHEKEVA
jgi:hypothetical protein